MNARTALRSARRLGWLATLCLTMIAGCGGGDPEDTASATQDARERATALQAAAPGADAPAATDNAAEVAAPDTAAEPDAAPSARVANALPNLPDAVCRRRPALCGHTHYLQPDVNGQQRDTIVYVSWRARQVAQAPVVFMLHGTDGNGGEFYNRSGWREKADAEGLIAIFPSALRHCYFQQDGPGGTWKVPALFADLIEGSA